MKSPHLSRVTRLSQVTKWLLLFTLLIYLLFTLTSFMKEPNTRPITMKNIQENLPEARSQAPHSERKIITQGKQVHQATAHSTGAQREAETRQAPTEQKGETRLGTQSPRRQEGGTDISRTVGPSLLSLDTGTTRGREHQPENTMAMRTVHMKPQGRTRATATLPPAQGRQATILATAGARSTRRRMEKVTTTHVPPVKKAQTTEPMAPSQSATTRSQRLLAANFRSQPKWSFEEQYRMDSGGLQPNCSNSLKVKASRSPWLQNLYLPNITLFLDSRYFNQSEWERLEHFAPPFGFMELNYSLVQKVVARFPPVPQQQLLLASLPAGSSKCITCAVVGNGGILNNSRKGQEIDSHDYVFRVSGALIKGYEQDVGTRTSFYGFTAFSLTQSVALLGKRGFKQVPQDKDARYLHFLEGTRDYEWLEALLLNQPLRTKKLSMFRNRPLELFPPDLAMSRYLLLHPDLLRYMKNRFLSSKTLNTTHWRIYRPTTGALLLLTALQLCDQVSAYGFITKGHERFSDHYYDKTWKKTIFYLNHDFKLERETWERLHDEGIIRLYQHPMTPKPKV